MLFYGAGKIAQQKAQAVIKRVDTMRRHFSLQRLLIVVAWAALSPQCALLVENWIGLFSKATVSDAAGVVPDFVGKWNRSSNRPGTVADHPATGQTRSEWWVPATFDPLPAERESARNELRAAPDGDPLRFLGRERSTRTERPTYQAS